MDETRCQICGGRAEVQSSVGMDLQFLIQCPVCGDYQISDRVIHFWNIVADPRRYILSGVIRQIKEDSRTATIPLVTTDNVDELMSDTRLPSDGLAGKLDLILIYLAHLSLEFGKWAPLRKDMDYPVAFAHGPAEYAEMVEGLAKLGLLEVGPNIPPTIFRLTINGWKRVQELRRSKPQSGNLCFVAMSFADDLKSAYLDGIKPAIRAAGYDPRIMWELEHNDKIDDRIIAEIRQSRLVVADFTDARCRGGVYFEAGVALGLGIPVIWACRSDQVEGHELHFDTRQYNHIAWQNAEDFREKLENRIRATAPLENFGRSREGG